MPRDSQLIKGVLLCLALCFVGCAEESPVKVAPTPIAPPQDAWFQEHVVDNPRLVVVDFYADWCGPCRQLSPLLVKLEEAYAGQVEIVKVNVDERESLAAHYDVSSIPMILLMHQGQVLEHRIGLVRYEELEEMVTPHLAVIEAEVVAVE